jgi:hypothetical protein
MGLSPGMSRDSSSIIPVIRSGRLRVMSFLDASNRKLTPERPRTLEVADCFCLSSKNSLAMEPSNSRRNDRLGGAVPSPGDSCDPENPW